MEIKFCQPTAETAEPIDWLRLEGTCVPLAQPLPQQGHRCPMLSPGYLQPMLPCVRSTPLIPPKAARAAWCIALTQPSPHVPASLECSSPAQLSRDSLNGTDPSPAEQAAGSRCAALSSPICQSGTEGVRGQWQPRDGRALKDSNFGKDILRGDIDFFIR